MWEIWYVLLCALFVWLAWRVRHLQKDLDAAMFVWLAWRVRHLDQDLDAAIDALDEAANDFLNGD